MKSGKPCEFVAFLVFRTPAGGRTLDTLIKSQVLYQLSYKRILLFCGCKGTNYFSFPQTFPRLFSKKREKGSESYDQSLFYGRKMMFYMKAMVNPAITMLTIDISLIRIFKEGPLVSLKGSPTVSPTMHAL